MNKWIDIHPHLTAWLTLVIVAAVAYLPAGRSWVYVTDAAFYGGLALILHFGLTRS